MSTIPLPALSIKTPEQPDTLQQFGQLLQLQRAKQQMEQQKQMAPLAVQQQQQENQIRGQQIKDQQAMTAAMQQWDGKDYDSLASAVLKNGGSSQAVMGLKQHALDLRTTYSQIAKDDAETGAKNVETRLKTNDLVSGKLASVLQLPDEQLGQGITSAAQELAQNGMIDPQHAQMAAQLAQMPPQQARQQLEILRKGYQADSQMLNEAAKKAEIAQSQASAAKSNAETQMIQQYGGTGVEAKELSDYMTKNPGKGASDFAKWKASLAPQARINIEAGLGGGGGSKTDWSTTAKRLGMTPTALDQAAEKYYQTGTLPAMGRGLTGPALQRAVMNRAADLHPDGNLAANSAEYKANSESLKKMQSQRDAVVSFENTAGKNLDLFLQTAKPIIDSGSPFVNTPLRSISRSAVGDDKIAAFEAARRIAVNEIAKVTNNPTLAGQLSDTGRKEVESLIPDNATLKQIYKVANILKQDMANRHQSYDDSIADIQRRIGGGQNKQQGGGSSQPMTITLPSGKKVTIE